MREASLLEWAGGRRFSVLGDPGGIERPGAGIYGKTMDSKTILIISNRKDWTTGLLTLRIVSSAPTSLSGRQPGFS